MTNRTPARKDIIEISAHDLHRLLAAFHAAIQSGGAPGGWEHAADWDWSFERLADILDEHYIASGHPTDPLIRCQHTSAYQWPAITGPARWVCIRMWERKAERHLIMQDAGGRRPLDRALCGFRFASEDIVKRPRAEYRSCDVCAREQRLQGITIEESRR